MSIIVNFFNKNTLVPSYKNIKKSRTYFKTIIVNWMSIIVNSRRVFCFCPKECSLAALVGKTK